MTNIVFMPIDGHGKSDLLDQLALDLPGYAS